MLRLRPYKKCDAKEIVKWINDERTFRMWCADRYDSYPITAEDIEHYYEQFENSDTFFEMSACDENGIVGHLIMRYTDECKQTLRFGFVIVDDTKRGKGYGKEMLNLALAYAFDILKVKKVTLGVFEHNSCAYHCYKAVGFKDSVGLKQEYFTYRNEKWKCLELEIIK